MPQYSKFNHPDIWVLNGYFRDMENSTLSAEEKEQINNHVKGCETCQVLARRAAWLGADKKAK